MAESRTVLVAQDRIGQPVALDEAARVEVEVLRVDPEDDDAPVTVLLPERLQARRFLLARDAPGGPEVEDHRLSPQGGQRDLALAVETVERECRRRGALTVLDLGIERSSLIRAVDLPA